MGETWEKSWESSREVCSGLKKAQLGDEQEVETFVRSSYRKLTAESGMPLRVYDYLEGEIFMRA